MRAPPRLVLTAALAALLVPVLAPAVATAGPDGKPAPGTARSPAEIAARATLDRWLAAQNGGALADYAALYAPGFQGVKRVGKTTKKMNRAAWLKDRKAMFKAPMKVGAADVKVTLPAADAAVGPTLELTQTWAAGAFADTGLKRITLDPAGALIVAEEMVSSRVMLTDGACLTALYPGASLAREQTGVDDGKRHVAAITVLDLGGRWACQVDVEREDGVDVSVAVLAFGKAWATRGRVELDYGVSEDPGNEESTGGTVTLARLALHATIPVLAVTRAVRKSGPQYSDGEEETTLYRADGDDLVELLAYASKGSSGEADSGTTCTLDVGDKRSKGWLDVAVACVTSEVQWAAGETEPKESREVTRYRWDGTTYAER